MKKKFIIAIGILIFVLICFGIFFSKKNTKTFGFDSLNDMKNEDINSILIYDGEGSCIQLKNNNEIEKVMTYINSLEFQELKPEKMTIGRYRIVFKTDNLEKNQSVFLSGDIKSGFGLINDKIYSVKQTGITCDDFFSSLFREKWEIKEGTTKKIEEIIGIEFREISKLVILSSEDGKSATLTTKEDINLILEKFSEMQIKQIEPKSHDFENENYVYISFFLDDQPTEAVFGIGISEQSLFINSQFEYEDINNQNIKEFIEQLSILWMY